MEDHPDAAFRANVVGTLNVCVAASDHGASKMVFVSTDKAVNPDNVYGATKRIGELLVSAIGRESKTTFAAVRFGNVMGSRGSVVPLFLRQIERGGPVLLTDPETTRYFMSAEEAASLVIQAASFADQGQIFILDMGEKVRIADLAEKMIRLKGYEPGRDIQIVYTGLRPGEKLHEELRRHVGEAAQHAPPEDLPDAGPADGHPRRAGMRRSTSWRTCPPRNREEIAARLHALARIDLRDTGEAAAPDATAPVDHTVAAARAGDGLVGRQQTANGKQQRLDRRFAVCCLLFAVPLGHRRRVTCGSPASGQHLHEDPNRRRRAAAVHQGRRVLARGAAAAHGDPRAHRAALRRADVGRLLRRAGTAEARPPPGRRLRQPRCADGADARAARGGDAARGARHAS